MLRKDMDLGNGESGTAAASSSSRNNRSLSEKERRERLRNLFSQLSSVLPPQPRKMTTHEVLERATMHVKQLQNRVKELREMKAQLSGATHLMRSGGRSISPVITITDLGSTLEVTLFTGWDAKLKLGSIIKILTEEGAQVLTAAANCNAGDHTILYSIHCQAICSRIGVSTSNVQGKLQNLIA